jgi:cytoskeletal protein RodZ
MPFPITPSITNSSTPLPSNSPSKTPTQTPQSSLCVGQTPTRTATPTQTPTPTNTLTATQTPTPTITPTPNASPTPTPTLPSKYPVAIAAGVSQNLCSSSCLVRYTDDGTIAEGKLLMNANGTPATGFNYVLSCVLGSPVGEIYNINFLTGVIGTPLNIFC